MGYKLICSQTLSLKESFKIKTNQSYIRSTVLKESFKTKIEYYVKIYNRIWLMTSIFQSSRVRLFFQFILRGYCQFFILSYLEREECNLLKNIYLIQINIYSILTKYQWINISFFDLNISKFVGQQSLVLAFELFAFFSKKVQNGNWLSHDL